MRRGVFRAKMFVCLSVCLSVQGFSAITRELKGAAASGLHRQVRRYVGQGMGAAANVHVQVHVREGRTRTPLQYPVAHPCRSYNEVHAYQTRWVGGHHGGVCAFGGGDDDVTIARAVGTSARASVFGHNSATRRRSDTRFSPSGVPQWA